MSDDPRPEISPETAPLAQQAGISKRRLLIKAALVGSTVPVVMTLSGPAYAIDCSLNGHKTTNGTVKLNSGTHGTGACH
ncbi:MAG: hypothetical protein P4L90_10035 [Rhodopila sp.]|nr:hypothetical protein [Rhodopila sp.]